MPQTANHCTEARSARNDRALSPADLRIPKKRTNGARSTSRSGISSSSSSQNSTVTGSKDTVCPSPAISTLSGATDATVASQLGIQSDISRDANHKIVRCVCHFLNISNPSADESFFLLCVRDFGFKQATFLAAKFELQCQRPSRELLAMMNGRGRNYSARSAKRKRLSGSLAVSRKHLSTA